MTSQGLQAFKDELAELEREDSAMDADRRQFLRQLVDHAHVIVPEHQSGDRVIFGATVTVKDEDGERRIYKLVGVDESDAKAGKVSWISPIGKALLGARVGDTVTLLTPVKEEDLEILSVEFKPIN
jgi:transcription elongation factor GreB